jgi:hypothetical protein
MTQVETRSLLSPVEASEDGMHFSGLAIKYGDVGLVDKPGERSKYFETIAPGAAKFAGAVALYQHDPTKLLGTVANGTLVITEDRSGIHTAIDMPNTSYAHDVSELVKRGDVRGQSFSFKVNPGGQKWETRSDGTKLRTLTDFNVIEFGPTAIPVYDGTTAAVRSQLGNDGEVEAPETRSTFSMPAHVGAANEALLQAQASIGANPAQAASLLLAAHNSIGMAQRQYLDPDTAAALGVDVDGINSHLDLASKSLDAATTAAAGGLDPTPHMDAAQATLTGLQAKMSLPVGNTPVTPVTPEAAEIGGRSWIDRKRHELVGVMNGYNVHVNANKETI